MDDKAKLFQEFLATRAVEISYADFLLNLGATFVLSYLLRWLYVRFGQALSNRDRFGNNFPMLALTTMVIITVVKSSLALSLGLVGALSIVRFRAAIKDPEELAYLFLCIAIGLGFGAGQTVLTFVGVSVVMLAALVRYFFFVRSSEQRNVFLTIAGEGDTKFTLTEVNRVLTDHCSAVDLKRFDESETASEAVFVVELGGIDKLETVRNKLQELHGAIRLTVLDQGVI